VGDGRIENGLARKAISVETQNPGSRRRRRRRRR
jgi:hypothetical protein